MGRKEPDTPEFLDMRTRDGRIFAAYVRAKKERLRLGPDAQPTLTESGLVAVELHRLAGAAEALRIKPTARQEHRRLRREQRALRAQLVTLERRLEDLSGQYDNAADPLSLLMTERGG